MLRYKKSSRYELKNESDSGEKGFNPKTSQNVEI